MAAAVSTVDAIIPTAPVKTRHVPKERLRAAVGGSFGDRRVDAERRREEGRLDERERDELLLVWGGAESALACRSQMGAVVDKLLRGPPRDGKAVEALVEEELRRHGQNGYERDRLVGLLADEGSCTRYEARRALRAMVGRGSVEFFKATRERQKRSRRLPVGFEMLTGAESQAAQEGKPEAETVEVEMARWVGGSRDPVPPAVPPEERWRRADAALEASWRVVTPHESAPGAGSRLPPSSRAGRVDEARSALRRLSPADRKVLERAYGTGSAPRYLDVWGDELLARVAPLTASVERARQELVRARSTPASRATVDRATFAADALRAVLDAQPDEGTARTRWALEREAFVARVRREAAELLERAALAYRQLRER